MGVNFVPPDDITDNRILTAEELSLSEEARILASLKPDGLRFTQAPEIVLVGEELSIKGSVASSVAAPRNFNIDTLINISSSTETLIEEYYYLVVLVAIVGSEHDPQLGEFSPQYQTSTENRENTRRYRSHWAIVSSFNYEDASSLKEKLGTSIEVSEDKFLLDALYFYPQDSNWSVGNYDLLPGLELLPLCTIQYYNSYLAQGYTWGDGTAFIKEKAYPISDASGFLWSLMAGDRIFYDKAVLNLIQGATNLASTPQPGQTTRSLNNSMAIANDQRVFFSNEARVQKYAIQHTTVEFNSQGQLEASATLNTNNPEGTIFSLEASDHRIFTTEDKTEFGALGGLGSDRTLTWTAASTAGLEAGDSLIIVPGISFPAGSGWSLPISSLDEVYLDGVALSQDNIRNGRDSDLFEYIPPANGEDFMVVWGTERAALHYIYKKITLTSDGSGTLIVPSTELGVIAFIEGVSGRVDTPVYIGLVPNTDYNALVYYPPRTAENWQFEISYSPYLGKGVSELDMLDGGTIASEPMFFLHTQGSGNSVFQGEANLRYSAIALHLPRLSSQPPSYKMNFPIQLQGENYPGPYTVRSLPLQIGLGLAVPFKGQKLRYSLQGINQPYSLNIALYNDNNDLLGARIPALSSINEIYQAVISFKVEKDQRTVLAVLTFNGVSDAPIPFDASQNCAIDLFALN